MQKQLLKHYKGRSLLLLIMIVIGSIARIYSSYATAYILDIFDNQNVQLQDVLKTILYVIVVSLISMVIVYIRAYYQRHLVENISNRWRSILTPKICAQTLENLTKRDSGTYSAWLTNDVKELTVKSFDTTFDMIRHVISIIVAFVGLICLSPWLGIASLLSSTAVLMVPRIFNSKIQNWSKDFSRKEDRFFSQVKDLFQGLSDMYTMNKQGYVADRVLEEGKEYEKHNTSYYKIMLLPDIAYSVSTLAAQMLIIGLCAVLYFLGLASLGAFLGGYNLSGQLMNELLQASGMLNRKMAAKGIWKKYDEVLKADNSVDEVKQPNQGKESNFAIETQNLKFSYENSNQVLSFPNFKIESNRKYLLKGSNGSGKSTLLKLLTGILIPNQGQVLYNGTDVSKVNSEEIFENVAYMTQQPYLFNISIRENICLGGKYTDEELCQALEEAKILDFVLSLEDGLDHIIVENGQNLSGGQRQRLVMARHFLRGSKFYIIDEATSNVDLETQAELEKSLLNNQNLGILMINHSKIDEKKFNEIINLG